MPWGKDWQCVKRNDDANGSDTLFSRLKRIRFEIAKRENVPIYIIFSDMTLSEMALRKPQSKKDFLNVTGVGQMKCDRYGDDFISEIKQKHR